MAKRWLRLDSGFVIRCVRVCLFWVWYCFLLLCCVLCLLVRQVFLICVCCDVCVVMCVLWRGVLCCARASARVAHARVCVHECVLACCVCARVRLRL